MRWWPIALGFILTYSFVHVKSKKTTHQAAQVVQLHFGNVLCNLQAKEPPATVSYSHESESPRIHLDDPCRYERTLACAEPAADNVWLFSALHFTRCNSFADVFTANEPSSPRIFLKLSYICCEEFSLPTYYAAEFTPHETLANKAPRSAVVLHYYQLRQCRTLADRSHAHMLARPLHLRFRATVPLMILQTPVRLHYILILHAVKAYSAKKPW